MSQEKIYTLNPVPQITDEDVIWQFNGQEIEFDMTDAALRKRFNDCATALEAREKKAPKDVDDETAQERGYTFLCEFFDDLFGVGIGKKLLGETPNIRRLLNCRNSMIGHVNKLISMMDDAAGYSAITPKLNREQRRATKRGDAN